MERKIISINLMERKIIKKRIRRVVGSVRDDGEKKSQERLLTCHNRKLTKIIVNPSLLYIV
jgi:transcription initiation factor IIE alpha subunit